ncbi:MAG: hypothetical protein A2140_00510 [Candidatus Muproteobacteria bacterium RBG_16_62_13]|uniref:Carrier domain-containing protein n=1 Tax=Candidatus Muproteobacteria bacterium RBG_16_62_13 TaxID=1817756 RepID=A0A1F6T731_9PROT|nr:MAG: hypothetical protein A2140_00510 [Candidatus Muproteobacteria bacterium RBG_16_62_13]
MTEVDVTERALRVISEILNRKASEISLDASLRNDLLVDSLQRMTLFIVLEDEFQRTIPLEEVAELDTINEIISLISHKLRQKSGA